MQLIIRPLLLRCATRTRTGASQVKKKTCLARLGFLPALPQNHSWLLANPWIYHYQVFQRFTTHCLFCFFDEITITIQLLNYWGLWSSISKITIIVIPKRMSNLRCMHVRNGMIHLMVSPSLRCTSTISASAARRSAVMRRSRSAFQTPSPLPQGPRSTQPRHWPCRLGTPITGFVLFPLHDYTPWMYV